MILIELRFQGEDLFAPSFLSAQRIHGNRKYFFPSMEAGNAVYAFCSREAALEYIAQFNIKETSEGYGKIDLDKINEWIKLKHGDETVVEGITIFFTVMMYILSDQMLNDLVDTFKECQELAREYGTKMVCDHIVKQGYNVEVYSQKSNDSYAKVKEIMQKGELREEVQILIDRFLKVLHVVEEMDSK